MKTLITTLAVTLMLGATSAFAQGVRNGDPGLALTDSQTLPEAGPMKKLAAAFERGALPSLEILIGRHMGDIYLSLNDGESKIPYRGYSVTCIRQTFGDLLPSQTFCGEDLAVATESYLVKFNQHEVYLNSQNMYFRMYDKQLIGVVYGVNGKCAREELKPNENNICAIAYLYK